MNKKLEEFWQSHGDVHEQIEESGKNVWRYCFHARIVITEEECPEMHQNNSKENYVKKLKFWKNMSPIWRALCASHSCLTLGLNMLNFMFHIHIQMINKNKMRKYMLQTLKYFPFDSVLPIVGLSYDGNPQDERLNWESRIILTTLDFLCVLVFTCKHHSKAYSMVRTAKGIAKRKLKNVLKIIKILGWGVWLFI